MLKRFWLLLAQTVTVGVGLMLAFTVVGPERQSTTSGPVVVREEVAAVVAKSSQATESYREAVLKALEGVIDPELKRMLGLRDQAAGSAGRMILAK